MKVYSIYLGRLLLLVALIGVFPAAHALEPCTVRGLIAKRALDPHPPGEVARKVKSLREIYPVVQSLFLSEIAKLTLDTKEKELLRKRLLTVNVIEEQCGEENRAPGSYNSLNHTIKICSGSINWPELSLVTLLAHEMGHAMDLCSMSASFFEVMPGARPVKFNPPLNRDNLARLETINSRETKFFNDNSLQKPDEKRMLAELIRAGKVKKVEEGIKFERNPLKPIFECLSATSGYNQLTESGKCEGAEFTEGGAQIWAAKVASAYINANFFCLRKIDIEGLVSAVKVYKKNLGRAPAGKERDFNEIFLKEKVIRGAFECTSPPIGACL